MLELVEAAFDQVAFFIDVFVERQFASPRPVRGDDGLGLDGLDVNAEVVGVEGGIGQYPLRRQAIDQRLGLGDIVGLARVRMRRGLTPSRYQSGEINRTGGISRCGDEMMRAMLYEVAHIMLVRLAKWSWLKA